MKKIVILLVMLLMVLSGCTKEKKEEPLTEDKEPEMIRVSEDISGDYYAISCRDENGNELKLDGEILHLYADGSGMFEILDEQHPLTWTLKDNKLSFTDDDGDVFNGNYANGMIGGTYFNNYYYMFTNDEELFNSFNTISETSPAETAPADSKTDSAEGCYYGLQVLHEPKYGIKTAIAMVPYGWSASVNVEWGMCSTMYPALGTVRMLSPDGRAMIDILSPFGYMQMARKGQWVPEGTYLDLYNVYLNYRNAAQYNDLIFEKCGYKGTILYTQGPDYEFQLDLNGAANAYLAGLSSPIGIEGKQCEGTYAKTSYFVTQGNAYEVEVLSTVIMAETVNGYFDNYTWFVPCCATFIAADEEAYSRYAAIFDNVVANTSFSNEFIYVVQRNAQYLNEMIHQYLMEKIYSPSSSDITGWDSEYVETESDKFVNAWCDVIKEQNEYVTADGNSIKVPTSYDSVYQDGDYIYMGPQAGAPDGWTELNKR